MHDDQEKDGVLLSSSWRQRPVLDLSERSKPKTKTFSGGAMPRWHHTATIVTELRIRTGSHYDNAMFFFFFSSLATDSIKDHPKRERSGKKKKKKEVRCDIGGC